MTIQPFPARPKSGLPIPIEALEDCGAILGRRGAGKSGTGRLLLEHELTAGHRCCVIDPKGDWHGIRMLKDGKPSPFNVPIFGGMHGDIQLTEDMGETLGRMIGTHDLSCVVDLSGFQSLAAMRRFAKDFADALYKHNRAPLTLFVDEADQLAPQRVPADMAKLLHAMETLIRLGRQRGIFMWMLTQRPQVLNKNLLSQAETLIAMKMTTPHDRKAIQDWMNAHDPDQAKTVLAQLSKLNTGEAFAWVPGADFLERVQFPMFTTFDSGRTPKHGEKVASIELPKIDLSVVEKALAAVKPVEKEKKAAPAMAPVDNAELLALRKQVAALTSNNEFLSGEVVILKNRLASIAEIVNAPVGGRTSPAVASAALPPRARPASVTPAPRPRTGGATPRSDLGPERRALAALAQVYPSGLTEAQWATSAGYKRSGGTWGTYKSRLRAAGMIEEREGKVFATEAGAESCGDVELPPAPGPELVRWWVGKLESVGPMAEALIEAYPEWLSKEELAARINMAVGGGSFGTYLSRLSGPGLIERDRDRGIRLDGAVMG